MRFFTSFRMTKQNQRHFKPELFVILSEVKYLYSAFFCPQTCPESWYFFYEAPVVHTRTGGYLNQRSTE